MVEKIIRALIFICLVAICVYLALWVLSVIGLAIPAMIIQIVWIVVVLVVLLYLWRAFSGDLKL